MQIYKLVISSVLDFSTVMQQKKTSRVQHSYVFLAYEITYKLFFSVCSSMNNML